jgi:hypothetical protein
MVKITNIDVRRIPKEIAVITRKYSSKIPEITPIKKPKILQKN